MDRWPDIRILGPLCLQSALLLMAIYQCMKFHLIPVYILSEICFGQAFIAKIKRGSNSINTGDRVMIHAFCNALHGPLSVYQVSFIYLQYF